MEIPEEELLMKAIAGYELDKVRIEAQISELQKTLEKALKPLGMPRHYRMSAEGRANISAAQKKRWSVSRRSRRAA